MDYIYLSKRRSINPRVPINLYPGLRIAQISFHRCDFESKETDEAKGKYFGATRPSFSAIYEDSDLYLIK